MNRRHAIVLLCATLLVGSASADRITLSNGRVVDGRVVREDGNIIVVEANGIRLPLDPSSVLSVERTAEWQNLITEAGFALRRGDVLRGIELLELALSSGAPREEARTVLEGGWNSIIEASASKAARTRREDLSVALGRLMDRDLMTTRTLVLASQSFFELQDYERAATALRRLPPDVLQQPGESRDWALGFMRVYVRRLLTAGDFQRAISAIEDIRRLASDAGNAELPLLHLARSAEARQRGDFRTALEIIINELDPLTPHIARNRVVYTIQSIRSRARESADWALALEQLEPIRELYPVEYRLAANEMIESQARQLLDRGEPIPALQLIRTIPADDRSDTLLDLDKRAYYESELARIGETQPLELLKLARWCSENGLYVESLLILERTRSNQTLAELSDELAAITRQRRDTELLDLANTAYRDGFLDEAARYLDGILKDPGRASLVEPEAKTLAELVRKASARAKERRPYDAEVLFQQAERAYYTQSIVESYNLLDLVLRQYPETPAAKRAAALQPDVVRTLEIAYLEGRDVALGKLRSTEPPDLQKADKLAEEVARLMKALEGGPAPIRQPR